MAWIRTIAPGEATGLLKRLYDDAVARAGKVFNVLRILRGSHPAALTCGEIGERTIARDPDVTRLVDQLIARGLVARRRRALAVVGSGGAAPVRRRLNPRRAPARHLRVQDAGAAVLSVQPPPSAR